MCEEGELGVREGGTVWSCQQTKRWSKMGRGLQLADEDGEGGSRRREQKLFFFSISQQLQCNICKDFVPSTNHFFSLGGEGGRNIIPQNLM